MDVNGMNSEIESDGSDVWSIPMCDNALKPKIGLAFSTLEQGVAFYKKYATACGFTTRRSTIKRASDGTIWLRYVVCTREGRKNKVSDEGLGQKGTGKRVRRRSSCRIECMAQIVFRIKGGVGYVISKFIEGHNHEMVANGYRRLMKVYRSVDYAHQMFIAKCAKANIGAAKSFRIFKEMVGGYGDIGCRRSDFKNASRDMKAAADGIDAQLLLEKFGRMREKNNGFFFSYSVDEDSSLMRLFWADSTAIQNYKIFGDAVSFDATYSTNKYSLIFTPFTGRDNHDKCVNFGAGLISKEDAKAYSWLLSTFVECMGAPPSMLITDQDLGLKAVVSKVLPTTRHRFCMWHIMMKLSEKLPVSLRDNGDFFQNFYDMVWSDMDEPDVFEEKWKDIITKSDLLGHKWFDSMYELRMFWIPAYFRDLKMSGLFRTTSLSECENSFFRRFLNKNANLSELYMLFEIAVESQREDHDALSLVDETCAPDLVTKIQIERHAAAVFTKYAFLEVQKEIDLAVTYCTIQKTHDAEGDQIRYDVDDDAVGTFEVTHNLLSDFLTCSCKSFIRKAMVCRHMFVVMRVLKYREIPDKYIEKRWTKRACSVFDTFGQNQYALGCLNHSAATQGVFGLARKCIGIADGNEEINEQLTKILVDFHDKHGNVEDNLSSPDGQQKVFEQYYGSSIPTVVTVHPPKIAKTKGSCSRKKSRREASIEQAKKPMRLCRKCNTMAHHDSRNCDKVAAARLLSNDLL